MFDALAGAIKELQEFDHHGSLTEAVIELGRLETMLSAARDELLGRWDRQGEWRETGARSAAAGLASLTREAKTECGARLWLQRQLRHLPLVAAALAAGDVTAAHARVLAHARNPRTTVAMARDEAVLLHAALTLPFREFVTVVEYWSMHADPDGADETDIERRDRRRVALDTTLGGMRSGSILLDPLSGETVANELHRLEQQLFETDWADTKARLGRDPKVGELPRSADQRRADALVEMATRSATAPAGGKAPKPLFQLVIGNDAFSHLLQLASGQVVSPAALLPWISGADLERYLFADGSSRVIDVSYKRTFEGALRDLIQVRDRLCYHHTCDVPAHRCQIDHIEPWSAGGITAQDNGRVACGYHNRLRHRRRPPPD